MIGAFACRWHDALIDASDAVLVGAIERGSGPPLAVHACTACVIAHDLLPLDQHPRTSTGEPRHSTGQLVLGPGRLVTR